MRGRKIYKFVCLVSTRERIIVFTYIQPASDVRVAFRLMRDQLKYYYGWKFLSLRFWCRLDKYDIYHYKLY